MTSNIVKKFGPWVILLVLAFCAVTSSAAAYSFEKKSDTAFRVYFNDPGDWKIAFSDKLADRIGEEGMEFAQENDVNLDGRTAEDIGDETQFHAKIYFCLPSIPFEKNDDGTWRYSHEAANPADIGKDDEYWNDYGPDIRALVEEL